jgi:DNA repair exonuclease SbcCD ATPase subunit
MKIKNLKLKNFAKFHNFEVEYDSRITRLIGVNGSGKTGIGITAIWACLKGIADKNTNGQLIGQRFRFIGHNDSSADITLTLIDEQKENAEIIVRNKITKAGNQITFTAPDGYKMSNEWLNNLLSVTFMSAKNFCELSPKEQAISLNINTEKYDSKIDKLKSEYSDLNRDIKQIGDLNPVVPTDKVSISDLLAQIKEIDQYNSLQDQKSKAINEYSKLKQRLEVQKEELELELSGIVSRISDITSKIETLPDPEPKKEEEREQLEDMISQAEDINAQAEIYAQYIRRKELAGSIQKQIDQNRLDLKSAEKDKLDEEYRLRMEPLFLEFF